jgi:uncharacterized membrane protein
MRLFSPLALVIGLALLLRLAGLASRPIWYDEAFSLLFAQKGWGAMLAGTLASQAGSAAEEHPIVYYGLAWVWIQVFGATLISARLFSVLAGMGISLTAYGLAASLWNGRVAFAAALLVAVSPFQVHYAQEIRMYAWMTFWLGLSTLFYARGKAGSWGWWAGFAFTAALAQYMHTLAAIYLVCLAAWPLLERDWRTLGKVFASGVAALALYLPWLVNVPAQFSKVSTSYWTEPPGVERIFTTLLSDVTGLPVPQAWLPAALSLTLLVVLLAFWQTLRTRSKALWWMFYLAFAPVVLLFTISQFVPVYVERALLPSGLMFCLWVAAAFWGYPAPRFAHWLVSVALAAAALIGLWQHLSYKDFPYVPAWQVNALVRENFQPGDVVVHSSKLTALPSIYADSSLPHHYVDDPPGGSTDTLALATQQTLGWLASPDIESAAGNAPRVWLVIFRESEQEARAQGLAFHPHIAWIQAHYWLLDTHTLDGVVVYLYSR